MTLYWRISWLIKNEESHALFVQSVNVNIIKKFIRTFLKVLGIVVASLLAIVILLLIFIRSPWGQGIVVEKATTYVSNKTNTTVSIDKLYVTFSGNLFLEGLYLEDTEGDTLLYSRKLEAGVEIIP